MLKAIDPLVSLSPHPQPKAPAISRVPDWDDFRVLMTVIKMGSFNRAADALGLTQPTISRRIATLEAVIGTRIVDRSTTGAQLTPDGQRIFDELATAHAALERALNQRPAKRKDVVTLLIADAMAAYWLTHFLPMFYARYSNVELRIFAASHETARRCGHYDLALHFLAPTDPDAVVSRLGSLHFVPYASDAYVAEHGCPASLDDLARHNLLDFVLELGEGGSWTTRLPDHAARERVQLFTNSGVVLAEAVRKGAGIAILPTYGSVFEKGLRAIEVGMEYAVPFWLCARQDALERHPVKCAARFLRHIFDRKAMPWFADGYNSPREFPKTSPQNILASYSEAAPCEGSHSTRAHTLNGHATEN